ncbi:MAG: ABC transporter permease [Saprospiraceae bacterium]|nr:ABC transporter permease [Saprospiraceae bacterium]
MSKIGLIAKREFLSRVTKKSFIIGTFLTPIVIGLFGFVVGKIMSYRDDKTTTIAVVDQSGQLKDRIKSTKQLNIVQPTEGVDLIKSKIEKKELDYLGVFGCATADRFAGQET